MNIPALALGVGLAAVAANVGLASPGSGNGIQCGIARSTQNGMLLLQATLASPNAISGDYRLLIHSSGNGGSTSSSQGGSFTADAAEPTILGQVMLNGGAKADVQFEVTVDRKKIDCNQDFAGWL